jgi:hypothetical protein
MLKRILIVATPMQDEWGNFDTIDVTCFADRGEGFKLCSGIRIPTDSEHLSKFDMKMDVKCSGLAEFEFNSEFGKPEFTVDKASDVTVDYVLNVVGQPMQYVFY